MWGKGLKGLPQGPPAMRGKLQLVLAPMKLCLVTHLLFYVPQPDSATLRLALVAVPFIHRIHA